MNVIYDIAFRLILTKFLSEFRKRGFNKKHVLIVGYSRAAEGYLDRLAANPQWGYHVFGILDDSMEVGTMYKRVKVIGTTDELERILTENELDEIAVTLSINEYAKLEYIVGICEKSGAHTKFVPDYHNIIPTIPVMEDMNGLPVINIRNVPLNNYVNRLLKRLVDVVGSIVAILVFSIPMLIVAITIKVTSPGPIIFSQVRVGLHNRQFKMYKFRSMVVQTEKSEKKAWTTSNDTRVTRIGKFIRKTSIDELPQLFNILMGNMSMVGPRPERPYFVEKFKEEVPRYMIKHQVRPGLTGWAQINGYRGDTSIRKRIEHDLYYIENWSIGLDFKILFLTIFKGFINKNAY
jgi:Undecaprenyl-phosphate glucose phosphotransferase